MPLPGAVHSLLGPRGHSSGCNARTVDRGGLPGELLEEVFAGPLLQSLGTISHQLPGDIGDEVGTLGDRPQMAHCRGIP